MGISGEVGLKMSKRQVGAENRILRVAVNLILTYFHAFSGRKPHFRWMFSPAITPNSDSVKKSPWKNWCQGPQQHGNHQQGGFAQKKLTPGEPSRLTASKK